MDYEADKEKLKTFLEGFYKSGIGRGKGKEYKYAKLLTSIANHESISLVVDLDDLREFDDNDKLIEYIEGNSRRYTELLSQAVHELLPAYKTKETVAIDSLDVFIEHRLKAAERTTEPGQIQGDVEGMFPPDLLRRFEVYWKQGRETKPIDVRALKANMIGKLVTVHGTVIRASEVRPLVKIATFTCDSCSAETFQYVSGQSFTPVTKCASEHCNKNKTGGRLQLQCRASNFIRFQEIKIQEKSENVPAGHVPRSLTVFCHGENTRMATAGDQVSVTGIFLPTSKSTAFAQLTQGLLSDTYLEAHRIIPVSKWGEDDAQEELTEDELAELTKSDFYDKLAASIAPEVYGHEDVKKSLLLQLVGGVERDVGGLKIRGTVNVCLMGDPGVAKSQILSYIDRLAPRSQMTSGRGSTGVGLTASIMRDSVTGIMTLEAGALMLADRGVCCIDEFDKMNEQDRTSLHEVMEQQTISIAKAGILTTLHARTSILAAANPAYGRYNPNRSIQENIALPAALLSRFDILWLLQDKIDQQEDLRLAKHITYVHQHQKEPPSNLKPLDMGLMRRYIATCRKINPAIPVRLSERLVEAYVELRKDARNAAENENTFTSPRSLLAIIRLATALARLRLSDEVIDDDVTEAIRLVERARESVKPVHITGRRTASTIELIKAIIGRMKDDAGTQAISIKHIRDKCTQSGFNNEQVDRCLEEYENMDVWHINQNRTKLTFV